MLINIKYDTETKKLSVISDGVLMNPLPSYISIIKEYEEEGEEEEEGEDPEYHITLSQTEKLGEETVKQTSIYAGIARAIFGDQNV